MEDLSLHILDIVENSIAAGAHAVTIRLVEDTATDRLTLEIEDDGAGMEEEIRKVAFDPFVTTKGTKKVGLGLALLAQASREAEGTVTIESKPGKGTRIRATFRLGHIDRKPVGDLRETLTTLIVSHPDIDFEFYYKKEHTNIAVKSREIIQQVGDVYTHIPEIVRRLREKFSMEGNHE